MPGVKAHQSAAVGTPRRPKEVMGMLRSRRVKSYIKIHFAEGLGVLDA